MQTLRRNSPNATLILVGVALTGSLLWLDHLLWGSARAATTLPDGQLLIARSAWVPFMAGLLVSAAAPLLGRARMTDTAVLGMLVTMMCLALTWHNATAAPGYAQLVLGAMGLLYLPLFIGGAALGSALRRKPG